MGPLDSPPGRSSSRRSAGACWIVLALILGQASGGLSGRLPAAEPLDRLSAEINAALADKRLLGATVGVSVAVPASGRVLYSRNGMTKFIVASNQKILTAATALRDLGVDYEFETTLFTSADLRVRDGTLKGDLLLRGGGDPTIGSRWANEEPFEQLEQWAEVLASAGVQRVSGDLVADDTFLDRQHVHPDWPRTQLHRRYCAPVSALSLKDNCVTIDVKPGANVSDPAVVAAVPDVSFLTVSNRCKTNSSRQAIWFNRRADSLIIEVGGRVRLGSGGYSGEVTVPEPALFAGAVFVDVLRNRGITVEGKVRLVVDSDLVGRSRWRKLASRRVPLADVLKVMLKHSNNMYAEHVVKTVGAERAGEGSWKAGLARTEKMLQRLHFRKEEFELADGSGMSRNNRLLPALICAVLVAMDQSDCGDTFRMLLPAPGTDGTLARRLSGPEYGKKLYAKTGYLRGVGALSGYAETGSGLRVAFSILINDFKGKGGNATMKEIEDRIVRALVDHG